MKAIIGALIGILVTYLFGALVGLSFNPADWHWVWRLIVVFFAVIWGLFGGSIGHIVHISDDGTPEGF